MGGVDSPYWRGCWRGGEEKREQEEEGRCPASSGGPAESRPRPGGHPWSSFGSIGESIAQASFPFFTPGGFSLEISDV